MTITFTQEELDLLCLYVERALEDWSELRNHYPRDHVNPTVDEQTDLIFDILCKLQGKDSLGSPAEEMGGKLKQLQKDIHEYAVEKGFWPEERTIFECLALIHSEVSEALEDYRDDRMEQTFTESGKPEGFPSEMADIVIRVMDLCEHLGIDLEDAIHTKMEYNMKRPYRHGRVR